MIQLWFLVLLCVSPVSCGGEQPGNYHSSTPYSSELECEEAGLKILRSSTGVAGRVAVCIKAVKPGS